MRLNFLLALILGLSLNLSAEKVIEKPFVQANYASGFKIEKITLSKQSTVLDVSLKVKKNRWFALPTKTYIQPSGSKEKHYVVSVSEPYALGERITPKETGVVEFSLTFPAVDASVKSLDYIEGNKGGNWRLYGVVLGDTSVLGYLPNDYYGSWLLVDSGNKWHISFLKDKVVYQGNVIDDFTCQAHGEGYSLAMNGKTYHLELSGDTLLMGDDASSLQVCVKTHSAIGHSERPVEELPAMDFGMGVATYSGVISNYTPRAGKTGTMYINNVLTGNQETKVIPINEDGTFKVEVELYYPQSVYVRFPKSRSSVVLVPGHEVKTMFAYGNPHYLGVSSELNEMYKWLTSVRAYDYKKVKAEIEDMSPADYISYCDSVYVIAQKRFASVCKRAKFTPIIVAFGEKCLYLSHVKNVLEYDIRKRSVVYKYKKKGKVYDYEPLVASDYQLMNDVSWDDPLFLLSPDCKSLINRIMYARYLRPQVITSGSKDGVELMTVLGGDITPEEQKALDGFDAFVELDWVVARNEFANDNKEVRAVMYKKYAGVRDSFSKAYDGMRFYADLSKVLEKTEGVELTAEEKAFLDGMSAFETEENIALQQKSYDKDIYKAVSEKSVPYAKCAYAYKTAKYCRSGLDSILSDDYRFLSDVMASQRLCPYAKRPLLLTDVQQQLVDLLVVTPEVKNYIALSNERVIAKLEANKNATGFTKNKVPETVGEKLFDEMIKPFRGKVIYVDFWATWCGPCLGGMERIKPLKEELKGNKDIVFMYITSENSPEKTYNAMIPDIKGEHYRLSPDDWNYIRDQFGVSGIPHYMLVNKKGHVVINDRSIDPGHGLKELLLKYAAE